jgi:hypothetical protein
LFRLGHHRSPDVPGQPWRRTMSFDDMAAMPARILDAFGVIEEETYLLAQDIKAEDK